MSGPTLNWTDSEHGVSFTLQDDTRRLPSQEWPLAAGGASPDVKAGITVLATLLEAVRAADGPEESVTVPHSTIAAMAASDLRQTGLPAPAPYTLMIANDGLVTDPGFAFRYGYVDSRGRRIVGAQRNGAFLEVGGTTWILQEPLFSLIDRMDAFNTTPAGTTDDRLRRLSEVQALAPEGVEMDSYLRGMQVALGTAFTLDIRTDADGELTFDPVVVRPESLAAPKPQSLEEAEAEIQPAEPVRSLPPVAQQALAHQFTRYREARTNYTLGGGWYLAIDESLRKALQVVREMKEAPLAQRRAFVANPHAMLRERLVDQLPEETLQFLFFEPDDYGDRVATAGIWQPKVLPFLKHSAEDWLPPETIGILLDGRELQLAAEDVPALKSAVLEAIAAGRPHIEHRGEKIPATQETLDALDVIAAATNKPGRSESGDTAGTEKHVLLLQEKDNLNELTYAPDAWKSRAGQLGIPEDLRSRLKPHQLAGLEWLQRHWLDGSPGALLADDMGLGKTIQALVFLRWMQQQPGYKLHHRPILIVAPTGLLANWVDEHDLHLDREGLGEVVRAYGPGLRALRHEAARRFSESATGAPVLKTSELTESAWVLTTYETLRDYAHSFGRVRWGAIVLDEAQKVKNPCALVTEECKAVCSNAEFVITMTGTPVENRLSDLWSIVDICQPGLLRDLKSFVAKYESEQYEAGANLQALHNQLAQQVSSPESPPQVMLRRMKWQELRGLPKKSVREIRRQMPEAQAARYTQAVSQARAKGTGQGGMLEALHGLRSISLHPGPVDFGESDERVIGASARLAETVDILDEICELQERALIFLESRALQPVLQGLIQRRYRLDHRPMLINGEVAGDTRKSLVRRFQEGGGFDVMILSPKAGGVGLTLTSANHVIHLTRWWNPAVEDQCTDRIYRIGQDREVHVYLPLAVHPEYGDCSFDERLHSLLERKRELSRQVLGLSSGAASDGDLQALFGDTIGRD